MTKAERIRRLYDGKRSTKEIAERVGCSTAYVRVVARQRVFGGQSIFDIRYEKKVRDHGDKRRARTAGKAARTRAKNRGASPHERHLAQNRAYNKTLMSTGRAALRKEAAHA